MSLVISSIIAGLVVAYVLIGIGRFLERLDWQQVQRAEAAERESWRGTGWRGLDPNISRAEPEIFDDLRLVSEARARNPLY